MQFWSYNSFRRKIRDNYYVRLDNEFRLGNDLSEVYYTYIQFLFEFNPSKCWRIDPGYRQEWTKSTNSPWIDRYIPMVDNFLILKFKKVTISDRNRVQFQIIPKRQNQWIYRNRLKFSYPIQAKSIEIRPFFDNEIFWRQRNGIDQNRTALGVMLLIDDAFHLGTNYLLRFIKRNNHWIHQNVIALRLHFNF